MDTKVDNVLNYIHRELQSEKQRKALLNRLAFEFGIRLHARMDTYARPAERLPVVVVGDYNTTFEQESVSYLQNEQINTRYKQNMQILDKIIKRDTWATKGRDFLAFTPELKILLNTLTKNELEQLDGAALLTMLRIVKQSQDPTVTNRTAYICGSFQNLVNGVDYKKRWVLKYKLEHGEITEDEFLARI